MRKLLILGLLVALVGGCGDQQEEKKSKKDGDTASQTTNPATNQDVAADEAVAEEDAEQAETEIAAIMSEFNAAMSSFMKEYREATADERQALVENELPKPEGYAERMLPLVSRHPNGDEARKALTWMLARAQGEAQARAAGLLAEHHLDAENLADTVFGMGYQSPTKGLQNFLTQVMQRSSADQQRLKGVAAYARVMQFHNGRKTYDHLKQQLDSARKEMAEEDEKFVKLKDDYDKFMESLSEEGLSYINTGKMADGRELTELLEEVKNDYADVVLMERGDKKILVGEKCDGTIFEMRNLIIGKTAPDIEGEDLDGEEFKLSDYRGKVVVLDFWGDW